MMLYPVYQFNPIAQQWQDYQFVLSGEDAAHLVILPSGIYYRGLNNHPDNFLHQLNFQLRLVQDDVVAARIHPLNTKAETNLATANADLIDFLFIRPNLVEPKTLHTNNDEDKSISLIQPKYAEQEVQKIEVPILNDGEKVAIFHITDNDDAIDDLVPPIIERNEAPEFRLENLRSPSEAQDMTNPFKVADIMISDDALGENRLSLAGDDANHFEIIDGGLFLKANTSLDFETKPQFDIQISLSDDSLTEPLLLDVKLPVLDHNEAPEFRLENLRSPSEAQDMTNPFKVADIMISDDALGENRLSLAGDDANHFEIIDGGLFLKANTPLDFETKPQFDIQISLRDPSLTVSLVQDFSLTILDKPNELSGESSATIIHYQDTHMEALQEFQVNTQTSGQQENTTVAKLANGGFIVVWESVLENSSSYAVKGQLYDALGQAKGDEFQINTHGTYYHSTAPDIATLQGNRI